MPNKQQKFISYLVSGNTSVPNLLLDNYKSIGVTDPELVVILHLLYFQGKNNFFPSIALLEERMSLSRDKIMETLQGLLKRGFIAIDEGLDEKTGLIYEKFNLESLYVKLLSYLDQRADQATIKENNRTKKDNFVNIFKVYEQEFGRPLSPIEIELISSWLDKDQHSSELIVYALKEAVFSNKLSFRYIDAILFDWQQKGIQTLDQVRDHIKHFRRSTSESTVKPAVNADFQPYNWLEEGNK